MLSSLAIKAKIAYKFYCELTFFFYFFCYSLLTIIRIKIFKRLRPMSPFIDFKCMRRALLCSIGSVALLAATSSASHAQLPAEQEQAATGQASPARIQEQLLDPYYSL